MNKLFSFVFLFFLATEGKGQTEDIDSGKYHSAKEHFQTQYQRREYLKYVKSQIKIEKNRVVINAVNIIEFPEEIEDKFKLILGSGLLYPMIINSSSIIKISTMNELPLLNPDPKTKRFSFWVFPTNRAVQDNSVDYRLQNRVNPDEYYFELNNESADAKTDFKEFIKSATLTYIGYGGIII